MSVQGTPQCGSKVGCRLHGVAKHGSTATGRFSEHGSNLINEVAGNAIRVPLDKRRDERTHAFDRTVPLRKGTQ